MSNRSSQIGLNIKNICSMKHIKTQDLATHLGKGTRQIQNIFNGTSDISQTTIQKIADYVGETVADIQNWHKQPVNNTVHEVKDNAVGVNHGTVNHPEPTKESKDIKTQVENLNVHVESLNKQMHDLRQVNDALMTLMTTINEQIQKMR
jgi:plasmid maintenance system antidote protein VapI